MTWLALDIATRTGWAVSSGRSGTSDFLDLKRNYPAFGESFRRFLLSMLREYGPDRVVVEKPFYRGGGTNVYLLGGLCFLAQAVCYERGIPSFEATVWEVRRHIGLPQGLPRKAAKTAVLNWARGEGYAPSDDNEADALALLRYAEDKL